MLFRSRQFCASVVSKSVELLLGFASKEMVFTFGRLNAHRGLNVVHYKHNDKQIGRV